MREFQGSEQGEQGSVVSDDNILALGNFAEFFSALKVVLMDGNVGDGLSQEQFMMAHSFASLKNDSCNLILFVCIKFMLSSSWRDDDWCLFLLQHGGVCVWKYTIWDKASVSISDIHLLEQNRMSTNVWLSRKTWENKVPLLGHS